MSLYLGENLISGQTTLVGESRNIGQIIPSTIPLTDAGLHLLDGALIQGDGIYSAFVTYIAGLVSTYPDLFVTEVDWQTAVTTYGVCGKFVYDSTNNTVRLPKYNSKIYTGGGTTPVVGNGKTLGLTDGTLYYGLQNSGDGGARFETANVKQYDKNIGLSQSAVGGFGSYNLGLGVGVTTDATKSGIIAQLSNITTSLDGYYYIVIATSTKTDIEVDIDEVVTDLNGKADVDLTNVNNSGTSRGAGWAMPSDTYVDLTLGASGSNYTMIADGWLFLYSQNAGSSNCFLLASNETRGYRMQVQQPSAYGNPIIFLPVNKGDVIQVHYSNISIIQFRFYYANGNESEAS